MSGETTSKVLDHDRLKQITCFVFDIDGVFTDTSVLITESGDLLRTMNVRDGQAVKFALEAGYRIAVFTKGSSKGVKLRLEGLGITDIYDGLTSKVHAFEQYAIQHQLHRDQLLYMGDDIPDLPLLERVGLPSCPFDATPEVQALSDYISPFGGGKGCVRDVIQMVMKTQGLWPGSVTPA